MPNIAFIAFDNCLASSICLPYEMLNAASESALASPKLRRQLIPTSRSHDQAIQILGKNRRIHCAGAMTLNTSAHPNTIENADLIILPAIWRNPLAVMNKNRYLMNLLKQWNEKGIMLCAVGTSSCFFAEAGLLNQRPATTHWAFFDYFQKKYPQVQLKRDFLLTRSDNIYCAGSVNSVADLIIYFIEKLFDKSIAKKVETNFSPEIRRSYTSSMYNEQQHNRHSDEDIVRLQNWLDENHANAIDINDMKNMLGISTRSLNRRFKEATQQTPLQYLTALRIKHASELLKQSNLSIFEIAQETGFSDANYFSTLFKKHSAMSPMRYREAVKGKLFSLT